MFTQPCFIRKNTPELREELINFGYKHVRSIIKNSEPMIFANNLYFANNFPYNAMLIDESIDCGTNEQLFIAIAALRDDMDKNQWFTNGDDWILCDFLHISEHFYFYKIDKIDLDIDSMHKATVEELIEHFKDK